MTALSYLLKMGRTKNPDLMRSQRKFGASTWAGDRDYCQTFIRESQLEDRLGISSPDRLLRMETVPQDMPNIGEKSRNRPVCFKVVKSASKLLFLKARFQQPWQRCSSTELVSQESICISSIRLDSYSIEKVEEEKKPFLIIVTTTWQTQSWYPDLLHLSVRNRIILPLKDYLIKGPQNQHHPLVQNQAMQLAVRFVSGRVWQRKEYQKGLQTLLSHQEVKVLSQLTHRPGISGLAGVLNKTLIQFNVM